MARIVALFLLTPSLALAADIESIFPGGNPQNALFSSPSVWVGGVVPSDGDNVRLYSSGFSWGLTYDAAAPNTLGNFYGARSNLLLTKDLVVTGRMSNREGTISDNGFDITVGGDFSNSSVGGGDYNGTSFNRGGGRFSFGALILGRSTFLSFRSGDQVHGNYLTITSSGTWPDIEVRQDAAFYGDALDQGLSFTNPTSQLSLGLTTGTNKAEIRLYWDSALQGSNDWILRWKGNHVSELTSYYNNGQIVPVAVPSGESFDPSENIFYRSSDDYTYIGFQPADIDGDGVPNESDVCPEDPFKTAGPGFCGCEFYDLDIDVNGSDETCVHITADVDETATLEPGAQILANAVVAPRATIGSTGQVGVGSVVGRRSVIDGTVGDDVTISRSVSVGAGSNIGNGVSLGYASTVVDADIGAFAVLGALTSIGSSSSVGTYSVVARDASIGDNCSIGDNVVIGPDSILGDSCDIDDQVRLRKEVQVGDNVTIGLRARLGRSVQVGEDGGAASTIGADAQLRANAVVPAGYCVADDTLIERGAQVDTACN